MQVFYVERSQPRKDRKPGQPPNVYIRVNSVFSPADLAEFLRDEHARKAGPRIYINDETQTRYKVIPA